MKNLSLSIHRILLGALCLGMCMSPLRSPAADQPLVYQPAPLRPDDAGARGLPSRAPGSHLKIYIPSLPYIFISHAINGALIRPANNDRGWVYDLATAHRQLDATTYEFSLRRGVRFQDGTPFDADTVLLNLEHFAKQPYLFTKIHEVLERVEKVDTYTVRFHLTQKYGVFMNDALWLHFYAPAYLEQFGWNGKNFCPNLAAPGPYGLGPYILSEGYIEGDRQTARAELRANPYYWDERYPKVERITIFTELDSDEAKDAVLYREGELDIAPIDYSYKVETMLSPYAKVMTSPSNDSWPVHINMRTGNPRLKETQVRRALNRALHQRNLLHFAYDGEGELSPTLVSPNIPGVRTAMADLQPYSEREDPYQEQTQAQLRRVLDGLTLRVLTQDRFLFLCRAIEHQLSKVGVNLELQVTTSEKEIFGQLLTTNAGQNSVPWDLLVWGDYDWFFNHPWSAFLVYRTHSAWSTIYPDPILDAAIERMFWVAVDEPGYTEVVGSIMQRVYDEAYMLFVPTPNKVLAVNKEVHFTQYKQAILPLWEIQITDLHPSVRNGAYPETRKGPVHIVKNNIH